MNSPFSPDVDAVNAELCPTCSHPLSAHDVIGRRWCAATKPGTNHRDCICSAVVADERVLAHY